MKLNFHIVDVAPDFSFEQDFEAAAAQALMNDSSDEASLMALAELVDLELATMCGALSWQGKRGERALKQRVLGCNFDVLVEAGAVAPEDLNLFQYVDDPQTAWDAIKSFYKL